MGILDFLKENNNDKKPKKSKGASSSEQSIMNFEAAFSHHILRIWYEIGDQFTNKDFTYDDVLQSAGIFPTEASAA